MRDSKQRNNELAEYLGSYCKRLAPHVDVQFELKALDELSKREMEIVVARLRESLQLAAEVNMPPIDPLPEATPRPPSGAEYLLFLLLSRKDRDTVIGDLTECYPKVLRRFSKRRANVWYCKEAASFLFPQLRRALLKIGALVWLGRVLRRLISWRRLCFGGSQCPKSNTSQMKLAIRRR